MSYSTASGSDALCPVAVESLDSFGLGHCRDLRASKTDSSEQKVDKIGRERLGRRFRYASIGLDPVAHACPELLLGDAEMIQEDVDPKA